MRFLSTLRSLAVPQQRPDATRVAGYHAWHELGRFVKKGEKGITIYAPVLVKQREPSPPVGETRASEVLRLSVPVGVATAKLQSATGPKIATPAESGPRQPRA